ncbi:hypothetical protein IMZ29_00405 [Achromobacter sp. GG226]|uniref:hypothetical protein n=1 Tax=Verticiella alkaliphila TaxID=2779529 RepID=UPI001C0CF821|nr:hypothetical protein [Verticiella sp. GG226]MBU4609066.1 hypothetical protein [Verticiella sp. GG226]
MTGVERQAWWRRPGARTFGAMAAGVPLGVGVALLLYAVFAGLTPLAHEFVSGMGIFGMPFFMGAATLCLSTPSQQATVSYRILAPWATVMILYVVLAAIAIETVICLIMLAPPAMALASAGGVTAGFILTRWRSRRARGTTLASVVMLPLLLGPLEPSLVPVKQEIVTISDRIVVAASADDVWRTLLQVPDIRDEELERSFSHAIGLPKPRAALMTGSGVGAVRDLYWDDGVHFRERITSWQPGKLLAYDVDVSPAREALRRLDTHVVIGDRYFNVENGRYELLALDDGRTQLTLRTTYRISTRVNGYGKFWADRTLHDFHRVVLALVRDRAETPLGTSVALGQ